MFRNQPLWVVGGFCAAMGILLVVFGYSVGVQVAGWFLVGLGLLAVVSWLIRQARMRR